MIQNQLNNRPRKKLGYKTPYEVFFPTFVTVLHLTLECASIRYVVDLS